MLSLEDRVYAVLRQAWELLPPCKREVSIRKIVLDDLGGKHGSWSPDDEILTLSTRLFWGQDAHELMYIDQDGNTPPVHENYASRALHTVTHELLHAIGTATGIDRSPGWLALSGWEHDPEDRHITERYYERRPGWAPHGPSDWRYRKGAWLCRPYSGKSPFEDLADCGTHIALGWHRGVTHPNGRAKFRFLQRELWGIHEPARIQAAAHRWRDILHSVGTEG